MTEREFEREFEAVRPYLMRIAQGYVSRADACDAVQDVAVSLWRHRARLRLPTLRSYADQVLRNQLVDTWRRSTQWRAMLSLDYPVTTPDGEVTLGGAIPDPRPGPEALALADDYGGLAAAIRALSPSFRTALLLVDVGGASYGEAAAAMGTSSGTLRSRLHRARQRVRVAAS